MNKLLYIWVKLLNAWNGWLLFDSALLLHFGYELRYFPYVGFESPFLLTPSGPRKKLLAGKLGHIWIFGQVMISIPGIWTLGNFTRVLDLVFNVFAYIAPSQGHLLKDWKCPFIHTCVSGFAKGQSQRVCSRSLIMVADFALQLCWEYPPGSVAFIIAYTLINIFWNTQELT